MNDSGKDVPGPNNGGTIETSVLARIERAVSRARLVLLWEMLWPRLAPLLVLAGLFAVLSWFGLWRQVADIPRLGILIAFAVAAGYFVFRGRDIRRPGRAPALARVEQATGALHRPATAYADRLATGASDPTAEVLWAAHRTRLLASLQRLKTGIPAPGLARRDPYAIRFLAALLFIVAFLFAGPERSERLGEAFRGGEPVAATIARIDAWVTPPAYTSEPPIFLTGEAAKPAGTSFSVPAGSVVTVRTGGAHDLDVVSKGETGEVAAETVQPANEAPAANGDQPLEWQVKLSAAATVVIRKGEREIAAWSFNVEPDNPPQIGFLKLPTQTASGAVNFTYSLKDDYGIISGTAEVTPIGAVAEKGPARPLIAAPAIPLSLPQMRVRQGVGETIRDLTSHPWAGARVRMTLIARDEAGQEGRSLPVEVILPKRNFTDPLARAVVEQRTRLALDANAADGVADALDAITIAPADSFDNVSNYLALRSAYYRLLQARDDDALRGVVDYLWTIALGIEDGDMSLAAQDLRTAQEALRKALENGASDKEIERLTQALREALQRYMQALAEEARRNPQSAALPPDANTRMLRSQDLEKMLDQIENLAKTGARDAAKQLLSQLQNMLENLQAGRPMQGDPNSQQMMQSLNDLADMIRRQQQLMDQTYQANRGLDPNNPDSPPMTREQMDQALRDLQKGQGDLQQALKDLMKQLEGMGMQPNGKLGQAGEAMGRAAGSLGQGMPGRAVGDQGEALDALRQGAQGLTQQFANNRGRGGGIRGGDNFPNEDPLGRPQRSSGPDLGATVKVPDEIDVQRAREILDAIRKRLGDPGRSDIERSYLERLLERF
jgi:uncharacterized protein (TIGR02302 family)